MFIIFCEGTVSTVFYIQIDQVFSLHKLEHHRMLDSVSLHLKYPGFLEELRFLYLLPLSLFIDNAVCSLADNLTLE